MKLNESTPAGPILKLIDKLGSTVENMDDRRRRHVAIMVLRAINVSVSDLKKATGRPGDKSKWNEK